MVDWESESDDRVVFAQLRGCHIKRTEMLADYIGNHFIGRIVCVICIAASSACVQLPEEQLPSTSPYVNIIGAEYRIAGDVSAYGIYERVDGRKVLSYITLIPGVGIKGSLVESKGPIAKGQRIKILSAWRIPLLGFTLAVYYLVTFQDADLPHDVPVRIDLSSGNEGVDAGLNPGVYEKLAK
jgi:hypothetical protein